MCLRVDHLTFLSYRSKGRMQVSTSRPNQAIFSSYTHTLHHSSLLAFFSSRLLPAANVAPQTSAAAPALQLRSHFRPAPMTGTRSLSKHTCPLRLLMELCTEAYAGATLVVGLPMRPMSTSSPCSTAVTKLWRMGKTVARKGTNSGRY
jgi:hypothetical protein